MLALHVDLDVFLQAQVHMSVPVTLDCSSVAWKWETCSTRFVEEQHTLSTLCIYFLFFIFIWAHFIVLQRLLKAEFYKIQTHFLLM
jgi:hypothetical protein